MARKRYVIIGDGAAGMSAAQKLRRADPTASIGVFSDDPHPAYYRAALTNYLLGELRDDQLWAVTPDFYEAFSIRRILGRVVALDSARSELWDSASGAPLSYDALLVATGARPRAPTFQGAHLPGVMTLRRIDQSDALAARLRDGGMRLVVIGAGWIGMEVAATARGFGNEVAILERDAVPLAMALGSEMGEVFRALHLEHGVDLRTSVGVERIIGHDRAEGVVVDGETLPADLVLVGVGATPNTALAEDAGLDILNGILTDAALCTSAPDVYAAGDVANAFHPVLQRHLRSEHWANALNAGKIAARSMHIAAEICVYTNDKIVYEELGS